jgi:hypothetical protein
MEKVQLARRKLLIFGSSSMFAAPLAALAASTLPNIYVIKKSPVWLLQCLDEYFNGKRLQCYCGISF